MRKVLTNLRNLLPISSSPVPILKSTALMDELLLGVPDFTNKYVLVPPSCFPATIESAVFLHFYWGSGLVSGRRQGWYVHLSSSLKLLSLLRFASLLFSHVWQWTHRSLDIFFFFHTMSFFFFSSDRQEKRGSSLWSLPEPCFISNKKSKGVQNHGFDTTHTTRSSESWGAYASYLPLSIY